MMKLFYKAYLRIEAMFDIKISNKTILIACMTLLGFGFAIMLFLGVSDALKQKSVSDTRELQLQRLNEKLTEIDTVSQSDFVEESMEISDYNWNLIKDNPDFGTVQRYANLLVGVHNDASRKQAYTAIPWLNNDVPKTLGTPQENEQYYNKPKEIELLTAGKTYGVDGEAFMFVYNTFWVSDNGEKYPVREAINIVMREGKVTYWSHHYGRREVDGR